MLFSRALLRLPLRVAPTLRGTTLPQSSFLVPKQRPLPLFYCSSTKNTPTTIDNHNKLSNITTVTLITNKSSVDDVCQWAADIPTIEQSDIATLKQNRVNGAALLTLTKEELLKLNFPLGAASNLMIAIDKLKVPVKKALDASKLQDPLLPARDDPRWACLHDLKIEMVNDAKGQLVPCLKKLKDKIGQFIELPNLGGADGLLPKKLDENKIKSFLMTQERYDLVVRFATMINLGQVNITNSSPQSGLILSGPNGVGKTFESYLLTCIAYLNNSILIYINMSSLKDDNQMAAYFLNRFITFNASKASTIRCAPNDWKAPTLLDLAVAGTTDKSQAFLVSRELMKQLATYTEHPVMYCLDEHQHLWKQGVESSSFGISFTIESGPCSGSRTILVVSGSAHSAFEMNLPSGMSSWFHKILPFSAETFKMVIQDEKSGLSIQEEWRCDDESIERLAEITGRLPRELQEMHDQQHKFKTAEDFLNHRKMLYNNEVNKYLSTSNEKQIGAYYQFMDAFFSRIDKMDMAFAPASLYDTGLIYFDLRDNVYRSICRGAFLALHEHYWSYRQFPTMSSLGPNATGGQFQRLVERAFQRRTSTDQINGFCLRLPSPKPKRGRPKASEKFEFEKIAISFPVVDRTVYIEQRDGQLDIPKHFGMNTLYIPSSPTFPCWDYILFNPSTNTIYFVQVSLSTFQQHESNSPIFPSFNDDINNYTSIASVTQAITGKKCSTSITTEHELQFTADDVKAHFIYITWSTKEQQRPLYKNITIFDKEACRTELSIQ
ncbi:hypothetical protein SAMD00019534_043600 [Acytostelium subglobosum LB1]|uniref:hypothetical protein n=1 Tax=Acytostelium subglobosum LB1 TaxID=1410327 RepID=UPI0006450D37|nr:hypothetical protein SAMD00019534_043600 [Acytostelium subglobosum LB1]GAM21185.1 hypothetical protein SAMD00019534_043600 [Acytostelium subglobosum LB1]|eukprot:XP_012756319.1 hypothetical protein SAMD00019534_043600 [Acytostelium subglobosum LB1]